MHLCKCACVCARARMFLHRWGLPLTEGKACCFVKRMVFFNCAGNPRLKTGDAVAKVRWLWRSLVMPGKISQLTPHFCFRIDYPKLSSKQPLRETTLHFLSFSAALPPEVFSPSGLLQATWLFSPVQASRLDQYTFQCSHHDRNPSRGFCCGVGGGSLWVVIISPPPPYILVGAQTSTIPTPQNMGGICFKCFMLERGAEF